MGNHKERSLHLCNEETSRMDDQDPYKNHNSLLRFQTWKPLNEESPEGGASNTRKEYRARTQTALL